MTPMSLQSRILSALIYADLFQYPLTLRELVWWIPSDRPVSPTAIRITCQRLVRNHRIGYRSPFFYLMKGQENIHIRTGRMMMAEKKMKRAFFAAKLIRFLPTIMFVGVTGSIAIGNAKEDDDIDFLIITEATSIWMTRFFVTVILELFRVRRHPKQESAPDKICLNMFMSDRALGIPKEERGWYSAHELLQCQPVWERGNTYKKLLRANRWVNRYFFTAWQERQRITVPSYGTIHHEVESPVWIEQFFRWIQIRYMAKSRTNEIVTDTYIRFHPKDVRGWIQTTFQKALQKRKVPLDKKFF